MSELRNHQRDAHPDSFKANRHGSGNGNGAVPKPRTKPVAKHKPATIDEAIRTFAAERDMLNQVLKRLEAMR